MDDVEEVRRRIDIVDLISSYLTVKKAGVNYRALCPFHTEKTPSMMISPEKQIFKCFGCSEGGDIFSFLMKMENLSFPEALKMLAERAGVRLKKLPPPKPGERPDQKTRLFKINFLSAQVFHKILTAHPAGKKALEYLKKRQLTDQTIKDYLIGYAPSSQVLKKFLKEKGFTDSEINLAGGPDRFYKRIIFPIRDVMGNVLGFTGRVIDPNQEPKYLNTPETAIFHKSRILFNLEKARGEIKLQKATVVVEGQMDVIASFQAGVKNVVATSGTALTNDHLQILYRYTPNIIFAFDADTAGLISAKKAYEMAIIEGFNVKMVELGEFKDPGEMVAKDPKLWQKAVTDAKPVINWFFDLAFNKISKQTTEFTSQQKKEIVKEILPVIKKIPDTIEQAHYVELLAKKLGVPSRVIFDVLEKVVSPEKFTRDKTKKENPLKKVKISSEQILLGLIIKKPVELKDFFNKLNENDFTEKIDQQIYNQIKNWYNKNTKVPLEEFLQKNLAEKEILPTILMEVEEKYLNENCLALKDELYDHIRSKKKENLKKFYAAEIAKAEKAGEIEKIKKLMKEFQNAIG